MSDDRADPCCPVCGRRLSGLQRRYCSIECRIRGGGRESTGRPLRDRPGQTPAWRRQKRPFFFDLTGQRFGQLVVLERLPHHRPTETLWSVRCDCGLEDRARSCVLRSGGKWRCRVCKRAAEATSAARQAPGAERGRCSWDRKPAGANNDYECSACSRRADRNGRDESGRPVGRVLVPREACVVCGQINGPGRLQTCSAACAARHELAKSRERDRRRSRDRRR